MCVHMNEYWEGSADVAAVFKHFFMSVSCYDSGATTCNSHEWGYHHGVGSGGCSHAPALELGQLLLHL